MKQLVGFQHISCFLKVLRGPWHCVGVEASLSVRSRAVGFQGSSPLNLLGLGFGLPPGRHSTLKPQTPKLIHAAKHNSSDWALVFTTQDPQSSIPIIRSRNRGTSTFYCEEFRSYSKDLLPKSFEGPWQHALSRHAACPSQAAHPELQEKSNIGA